MQTDESCMFAKLPCGNTIHFPNFVTTHYSLHTLPRHSESRVVDQLSLPQPALDERNEQGTVPSGTITPTTTTTTELSPEEEAASYRTSYLGKAQKGWSHETEIAMTHGKYNVPFILVSIVAVAAFIMWLLEKGMERKVRMVTEGIRRQKAKERADNRAQTRNIEMMVMSPEVAESSRMAERRLKIS